MVFGVCKILHFEHLTMFPIVFKLENMLDRLLINSSERGKHCTTLRIKFKERNYILQRVKNVNDLHDGCFRKKIGI